MKHPEEIKGMLRILIADVRVQKAEHNLALIEGRGISEFMDGWKQGALDGEVLAMAQILKWLMTDEEWKTYEDPTKTPDPSAVQHGNEAAQVQEGLWPKA